MFLKMDENTRMMIQLASMMMQNQSAIRETQKEIETAIPAEGLDLSKDKTAVPDLKSIYNGSLPLNMDPQLMAEFARQIVMNANHGTPFHHSSPSKKSSTDKPTTIAQMIQSQNLQNIASLPSTTTASSEGKIFVYNTLPDADSPLQNGNVKVEGIPATSGITNGIPQSGHSGKRDGCMPPIRNKYGRVLRPGIDNFGSFEAVANPGLIMQAMELMRQKDKKKRGPKEKETFSVFIYCLPDKNSKLPKFSSLDPMERSLVDQHQQEGYGYPSQDYINGIPRKTQLCLSFGEEKFHSFMTAIYPKLEGRLYDMYRIDKTRRLIRVNARSPRQLKDMKYQGSVIVIPYDTPEDRPSPIIHRNFDECYNGGTSVTLGNPLTMIQNFNIPLPSLPELVDASGGVTTTSHDVQKELPIFPGHSPRFTHSRKSKASHLDQDCKKRKVDYTETTEKDIMDINGNNDSQLENGSRLYENSAILSKISEIRSVLNPYKRIHIKPETLFVDILKAYRENSVLESHLLSVSFQVHTHADDPGSQHDEDVDPGSVFVMFWEEAFRTHFVGQQDMVPVIEPGIAEDLFEIFGRILIHGLILENYLPLKLSPACLTFLLSGNCSYKLLLTSFYRCMSDSEKEVLENCKEEIRCCKENFSPSVENSLRVILGSYGCKKLPQPYELEDKMAAIAKSYLVQQPFWALQQIQEGVKHCWPAVLDCCTEDEVVLLVQALVPTVPRVLERVTYIYSDDTNLSEKEQKVKTHFEEYVFKLPKAGLPRLLYQWCGFDCLCVSGLFVKFSGNEDFGSSIFCPKQAAICLPSACTSVEELRSILESHIPSSNMVDL